MKVFVLLLKVIGDNGVDNWMTFKGVYSSEEKAIEEILRVYPEAERITNRRDCVYSTFSGGYKLNFYVEECVIDE